MNYSETKTILEKIRKEFNKNRIAAMLREPEKDEEVTFPLLATLHKNMGTQCSEVMGEFYFYPFPEGNQSHVFTTMFTISENINEETLPLMVAATTFINYYLPFGAYVLNSERGVLAFKNTVTIPIDFDESKVFASAEMAIAHSLDLLDRQVGLFNRLEEGTMTMDQFIQTFIGQ